MLVRRLVRNIDRIQRSNQDVYTEVYFRLTSTPWSMDITTRFTISVFFSSSLLLSLNGSSFLSSKSWSGLCTLLRLFVVIQGHVQEFGKRSTVSAGH